jgi:iron complex outermembrane receptor protein
MTRRRPGAVFPLLCVLAAPAALAGQQDTLPRDTAVFRIEGISIQAQRPVTTIGGASAVEVRVDSLGLPAAPTAEEVLRELPAVHVRTNSRGQAEVSVRGSESRQVAILLDGVPLTLNWDARTDVSVLPAGAVRDINFVRGLSSILHGPNVLGGVVEMNLARGGDYPQEASWSFNAGVDHVGSYATSAQATRPFETDDGTGLVRFGVGWRDSPGAPLADGIREPVPGRRDLRLNTDMQNLDGFLALRYTDEDGAWGSFSAAGHQAERGIAAELGTEDARFWRYPHISRGIVAVSGGTGIQRTPFGEGDLEASVGLDLGRTEILSYQSRGYDAVDGTEDGEDRTVTVRLLGDHTLGRRADLRASMTFADINHDEVVDGETRSFQQRLFSAGAETVVRLVEDPGAALQGLRLSFGGAYDRGSTPETGGLQSLGVVEDWGARVGLSALTNDGRTLYHLGLSRRGRFPSLRETYSEALNRFVPNPELGPERLVAVEGGVTTALGSGEIQLVGFHHRLTDAIRRITFPDGRRQRINSEELTSTGVEVLLSQSFGPLSLGGDLTLQAVELTDPETALSTEPENLPEQEGRLWVRAPLAAGVSGRAEAEYIGAQFCQDVDTGQDVELDGGTWLNAVLSRVWRLGRGGTGRNVETSLRGENLTGTALYDQCGLPRPGRIFRFQVRVF